MLKTFEIMEQIRTESSKKKKAEIIEKHKDNQKFIRLAVFMLDGNVKTNISGAKINKQVDDSLAENISDFGHFLDFLALECTGTNANIATVKRFIRSNNECLHDFLVGVATKSYKFGVSAKSFNAIVPVISTHEVQRAKLFSDEYHKLDKKYPNTKYYFTEKLDGIRGTAFIENGEIKLLSRNNKPFFGLNDIFVGLDDGVYDGEFIIPEADFNSIQSTVMSEDASVDKSSIIFKLFDIVKHKDYEVEAPAYSKRREFLDSISDKLPSRVKIVECLGVCNYAELLKMKDELFANAMEKGWEGLMVNVGDSPYQYKKTDAILKVKEFETIDLPIVGFNEGEGRLKGTTGSVRCEYKGFIVDVPSMKDEMRAEFWSNQDKYIGKTIEVKYFQESTNEKGGLSLRFPSFVRLREDK